MVRESFATENAVKAIPQMCKKIPASFVLVTSSNFWKLCLSLYILQGTLILFCDKEEWSSVCFFWSAF